jgi:hypothetical protein
MLSAYAKYPTLLAKNCKKRFTAITTYNKEIINYSTGITWLMPEPGNMQTAYRGRDLGTSVTTSTL